MAPNKLVDAKICFLFPENTTLGRRRKKVQSKKENKIIKKQNKPKDIRMKKKMRSLHIFFSLNNTIDSTSPPPNNTIDTPMFAHTDVLRRSDAWSSSFNNRRPKGFLLVPKV